jgi:hypothetical protein
MSYPANLSKQLETWLEQFENLLADLKQDCGLDRMDLLSHYYKGVFYIHFKPSKPLSWPTSFLDRLESLFPHEGEEEKYSFDEGERTLEFCPGHNSTHPLKEIKFQLRDFVVTA